MQNMYTILQGLYICNSKTLTTAATKVIREAGAYCCNAPKVICHVKVNCNKLKINAIKLTQELQQVTQQKRQNGIKINPKEGRKKRKQTTDGANLK